MSSSSSTCSPPISAASPTKPLGLLGLTRPHPLLKSSEAAAVLNTTTAAMESIELGAMADDAGTATSAEDVMHIARLGDIPNMEKVFGTGKFDAMFCDGEGITPLHWAAINNQYAMCKFLLEHGADVDARGGTSVSTPLQWAVQTGHYYTANLLLQHGADPLVTDGEGYNTLHISTFAGNVLLLALLLHCGIAVDVLDRYGHTGLMWSAFKGNEALVDVFLRWGADVHLVDKQGFTALHWALVHGNPGCIMKIVEYGADRFARTHQGKTPAVMAEEQHSTEAWSHALYECGYDQDGHPVAPFLPGFSWLLKDPKMATSRFLFLWPFLILLVMTFFIASLPIYYGIPFSLLTGWGLLWIAQQVRRFAPPNMKNFHKTTWMAGIFSGSLALVGLNWLVVVFPHTFLISSRLSFFNLLFATLYAIVVFFYVSAMRADPGFVPKMNGLAEQKKTIDELLSVWKFDESNFCVHCMVRRPIRSKHCGRCRRCVAKHDHHCPWIHNCVGINNHRHFFIYIISLALGIVVHDTILFFYFQQMYQASSEYCNILGPQLCQIINSDPFTLVLGIWITLQLTWVVMLLFVQFVQVSRAVTTYEHMHGGVADHHAVAVFPALSSTGVPLNPSQAALLQKQAASAGPHAHFGGGGHSHGGHGHGHGHGGATAGWFRNMARLLGVEPFLETIRGTTTASGTKTGAGSATGKFSRRRRNNNPFSQGCLTNCRDFWCDPAPVFSSRDSGTAILAGEPINYMALYDAPTLDARHWASRRGDGYEAVPAAAV